MCVFLHWALPMECNTCPTKTFNLPSESQNLKKIQNSHSLLPTKFPLHWATISTPPVTPLSGRIFQFQSLFSTLPGLLYLLPLSESWLSDFEISHIGCLPPGCPWKNVYWATPQWTPSLCIFLTLPKFPAKYSHNLPACPRRASPLGTAPLGTPSQLAHETTSLQMNFGFGQFPLCPC